MRPELLPGGDGARQPQDTRSRTRRRLSNAAESLNASLGARRPTVEKAAVQGMQQQLLAEGNAQQRRERPPRERDGESGSSPSTPPRDYGLRRAKTKGKMITSFEATSVGGGGGDDGGGGGGGGGDSTRRSPSAQGQPPRRRRALRAGGSERSALGSIFVTASMARALGQTCSGATR